MSTTIPPASEGDRQELDIVHKEYRGLIWEIADRQFRLRAAAEADVRTLLEALEPFVKYAPVFGDYGRAAAIHADISARHPVREPNGEGR